LETGKKEGKLIGALADTHIYMDHLEGAKVQISRQPLKLPQLNIPKFTSIFEWTHDQIELIDYNYHPHIKFPIAI
jgi:thymidylate synthase